MTWIDSARKRGYHGYFLGPQVLYSTLIPLPLCDPVNQFFLSLDGFIGLWQDKFRPEETGGADRHSVKKM